MASGFSWVSRVSRGSRGKSVSRVSRVRRVSRFSGVSRVRRCQLLNFRYVQGGACRDNVSYVQGEPVVKLLGIHQA
jgi:hypothetical protein